MSIFHGKTPVNAQGGPRFMADQLNPGARRPPAQPLEKGRELFPMPLGPYLHIPLGAIPDPAGNTKPKGLTLGGIPESDPLNPSLDPGKKG
jgi:hypothetical protein